MPQVEFESKLINNKELSSFCQQLLETHGLTSRDASSVSKIIVEANLRGIDSHGVARLPHYLSRLQKGSINACPQMETVNLGNATARVDGDHGLGHLVMRRAAQVAIDLAKDSGAGWVSVCNSSHCGALANYGLMIADAGMIGIVFSHVDPMVLPFGSSKSFCGTNPICITAPQSDNGGLERSAGALCLDMATSKVPWNTVANAAKEEVAIPEGWAVDAKGEDTTDASQVEALYPFGDYKGSGLGLMIDVLCSMLSNSPFGPDIPKMYGDLEQPRLLGGLIGAIDISRFLPLEKFHERVSELIQRWNGLPSVNSDQRVMYPGEPELIVREQRVKKGIPLGLNLIQELDSLADQHGLERMSYIDSAAESLSGPHHLKHIRQNPEATR